MWLMISNIFFFPALWKNKLVLSFVKCFKTLKQNICFSCRSLRWKILVSVQCKTAKKFISPSAFPYLSFTVTTEDGKRIVNLVFRDGAIKSAQCCNPQQYLVIMNPGLIWRHLEVALVSQTSSRESPWPPHLPARHSIVQDCLIPCPCLCYWTSAENPSPCPKSFKIWRLFSGQVAKVKLNWQVYFTGELRWSLCTKAQM